MDALPLAGALIPSLLLLWYFHSRDVYPEPPRVVWTTFFLGVCTIPFILAVALPVSRYLESVGNPIAFGFWDAFLAAALPEEVFKLLVLTYYSARHSEFNEPMDGVVYGVAASLGFATLENVLYVGGGGLGVALLRAFSAVPGHAFTGVAMGYYLGRAHFAKTGRGRYYLLALVVPVLLHGLYDFPLMAVTRYEKLGMAAPSFAGMLLLATPVVLIFEWRLALHFSRTLRKEQGHTGMLPQIAPAPVQQDKPVGISVLGWVLVFVGGILATGGGFLILLLIVGYFVGEKRQELTPLVVGGAIMGGLPLLVGLKLFRVGIRRMNQLKTVQAGPTPLVWS